MNHEESWREKSVQQNFYKAKGIVTSIFNLSGLNDITFAKEDSKELIIDFYHGKKQLGKLVEVNKKQLIDFDIKQVVYFIDINYVELYKIIEKQKIVYKEVSKFPAVQRDLALIVNRSTTYESLENVIKKTKLSKLKSVRLFDVFESNKLGIDKKSMAVNFTFLDEEKTLTDKETDSMVNKLIEIFQKELGAEIRK